MSDVFEIGKDGDVDAAVAHLLTCEGVKPSGIRWIGFGKWIITSSTATGGRAITLKVYRVYSDGTPMWERYQVHVTSSDLPDVFRNIFMIACSKGYPVQFAGDKLD